ncbi:hypothetical protein J19TS2_21400 [Cohnella xylanilytica]|uniref:N-acetylmuramoyl-L-alanine amidase n=1 Tax=Cohnella xylanilytica TaxID=557555 RepID=A0A841TY17_9BACL|nr:N-acetylmuramoyl-L-alanine amidase [Cohnella xylanilytica]MBB6691952.1 N-acetylmuramoyl-L-alanine amidase [Cohnella xylanilytica]GIO12585.1 hypothetical protein J19TS2_21400 [Cohnella xylanilytica]
MRIWMSALFAAIVVLCLAAGGASAGTVTPKLVMDGKPLEPKEPPQVIGSTTMIPVRVVTENLGYKVDYDSKQKRVTVQNGRSVIVMTLNDSTVTVDGEAMKLPVAPTAISDTTLIPLRFTGEAFGLKVYWDNLAKSAFLYTPPKSGAEAASDRPGGSGEEGAGEDEHPADPSSGGTGSQGEGKPPEPAAGSPDAPSVSGPAVVREAKFENDSVVLSYEGKVQPRVTVMTAPDRIVVDLPDSGFSGQFVPAMDGSSRTGKLAVEGHPSLQAVRYSVFSDKPSSTLRFVLDLNQPWNYQVSNDAATGQVRIWLPPDNSVPAETEEPSVPTESPDPADPTVPTDPTVPPGTPPDPGKSLYTVVLDAGHGGKDPGVISISKKFEKDFTLPVILKLQAILAADPRLHVVLTRDSDVYPTLRERTDLANSLQADLFLSVHGNSNKKSSPNGSATYYTREASRQLAETIQKFAAPSTGLKDNGIIQDNLFVTRETTMPAVLYEAGFLSNASDEPQMYTDAFQDKLAQGLAAGIKAYLNLS